MSNIFAGLEDLGFKNVEKVDVYQESDSEKKKQEADREIALERERAISELKNSVADLALVAAEKLMEQHSGEESDKRLYDAFLEDAEDHHD